MCALFVNLSSQELVDDCSAQVAVSAAAAQPKQVSMGYLYYKNKCFGSGFGLDTYPDPGGQKSPTKIEKNLEISCLQVLDFLF
jgi:hypothetical protein